MKSNQTPHNYLEINRKSWNKRLETHLKSDFYDVANFIKGKSSLNKIELDILGDLSGKKVLHLQCHFGQDSISLSRLGADIVGIDLSDQSIAKAKELAKQCDDNTRFVCCDIYDLPNHLDEKFDIVFTSYGTISWLPDLDQWAHVIQHFLKPEGRFVFAEFHPVVWMFDDDLEKVGYHYFNREPIAETEDGSYADRNADFKNEYVCWNHGLSEVIGSLQKSGLQLNTFQEYDYSPYSFIAKTIEFEPGKFRVKHFGDKVPLVYSLTFSKKVNAE